MHLWNNEDVSWVGLAKVDKGKSPFIVKHDASWRGPIDDLTEYATVIHVHFNAGQTVEYADAMVRLNARSNHGPLARNPMLFWSLGRACPVNNPPQPRRLIARAQGVPRSDVRDDECPLWEAAPAPSACAGRVDHGSRSMPTLSPMLTVASGKQPLKSASDLCR